MDDPDGLDPCLSPVRLGDRPIFDRAFSSLKHPISDYTFASTLMWSGALKLYWAVIHGHLCLFANGTGDLTMLLPPIADPAEPSHDLAASVDRCFEIMDRYNRPNTDRSRIEYVSDELLERFSETRRLNLSASPMWSDYVYENARMIDLAGGSLKSKRHSRSKFLREFPRHATAPLGETDMPECVALVELWRNHGDAAHEGEVNEAHVGTDVLRDRDLYATQRLLENFSALGLRGMTLRVGGRLAGFTVGESLGPDRFVVMIEKTHPDFPGAAQFIFSEFCRRYWGDRSECNVGDDWGIPSLRFTKESYRPKRMLSKYVLTRQPVPVVTPGMSPIAVPAQNPVHALCASESSHAADPSPLAVCEGSLSNEIVLRRAVPADARAIYDLEKASFESEEETFNRRQIRGLIENPRAAVTVVDLGGRVVGWAVGLVRHHRRCKSGRLYAVAVSPDARGRHLGRKLVEATLSQLAATGIERMYLEVRANNAAAISLYHKLGFEGIRGLPNYYGPGRHGLRMRTRIAAAIGAPAPAAAPGQSASRPT